MARLDFISANELLFAKQQPISVVAETKECIAPHLRELLRQQLEEQFGKTMLYNGGLLIQTTLNVSMQRQAQQIFKQECARLKKDLLPDIDGALLALDRKTGDIKAMVGGYDFQSSKFNRAWQARRQVGSVFKPLIFTIALQKGKQFTDTAIDEPIELMQDHTLWSPKNYNEEFLGQMTLAYALSHSNNMVSIKTLLDVGVNPIIQLARDCQMQGPFHRYPSLALGTIDATCQEVAGMFNVFANNGIYVQPHAISWIKK